MRVVAVVMALLAVTMGAAFADSVTLDDWGPFGADYYDYHYTYYRDAGTTLVANQSTWTLFNVVGLDGAFSDSTGPVYWDAGVFSPDLTAVTWTYLGGEDGSQQDNYTTFDLIVYHPGGNTGLTRYEIDTDGDGESDTVAEVLGPTPEPGTMALALLGIGAIAVRVRRRGD